MSADARFIPSLAKSAKATWSITLDVIDDSFSCELIAPPTREDLLLLALQDSQ
jgi:hypothetical protein